MKSIIKYYLFLVSLLFCSCSESYRSNYFTEEQKASVMVDRAHIKTVNTDSITHIYIGDALAADERLDINSIIDSVKVVFFDDSCVDAMLGDIEDVIITDKYIYVMNRIGQNSVAIFDIDGHFVKRIPIGQGPGEVTGVYQINYDKYNKKLILSFGKGIAIYEENGDFVKNEILPLQIAKFLCTETGYICLQSPYTYNDHLCEHQENSVMFVDREFRLKWSALPHFNYTAWAVPYNLLKTTEDYLYVDAFNDTIYSIDEKGVRAKYVIDLGPDMFPMEKANDRSYIKNRQLFDKVFESSNYAHLAHYLETSTHQYFWVTYSQNGSYDFYRDKRSGNIVGGKTFLVNDNVLPILVAPRYMSEDWFVIPYQVWKTQFSSPLISKEANERMMQMEEESNQVLFMFKLKRF